MAFGAWAQPGLWDAHVHFAQWVRSTTWLDVAGTRSAAEVCARVSAAVSQVPPGRVLVGFGYRSAPWSRPGTVAELDAVSAGRPVILVAGDAHNGWLNSAALALLGVPRRDDPLAENEWFDVFPRLGELPGGEPTTAEVARAVDLLASRGLTGIVDLEFSDAFLDWPARVAAGIASLRVRAGCYEHQFDHVLRAGWTTGDALPGGAGLVTMGPLKIISDGSLGTGTAWCCEPYAGRGAAPTTGAPNLPPPTSPPWCGARTAPGSPWRSTRSATGPTRRRWTRLRPRGPPARWNTPNCWPTTTWPGSRLSG